MKKLFINNNGQVVLKDVRAPLIETKGSIVKTSYSLISSGTELSAIRYKKIESLPLIKKLFISKEFRKRLCSNFRNLTIKGIFDLYKIYSRRNVYKNFKNPSFNLVPIGYSCSGLIQESNIQDFKKNDRVACAGSNHAELIYSPKNLTCKIPENVSLEEAAFATLGAISLHSIHRADIMPGEYVGIIGSGLLGLITVQLAKVSGARIIAFDLINKRLNLAKKFGAELVINPRYYNSKIKVNDFTDGKGLDKIIICASSKSPKLLEDAIELIRQNGKIVILGAFPISVNRDSIYYKEADLLISRSYGPGRYDSYYEYNGYDYPKKYVPWTEQRNIEFFLKLISKNKIDVKPLISDIIPIENANEAYIKLDKDPFNNIGILLKFTDEFEGLIKIKEKDAFRDTSDRLIIGLIGCGSFPQSIHLPHLISNPNCKIKAICTNHKKTALICKEKYHPNYITTNYKEILKDPEIETVFIYTRHNTHEKFTVEALKAGKNVYVEKPMAITWQQCKNVYNAVETSKKLYTIGFNRRYSPFIKITRELLRERNNPIVINYRIANSFLSGNHWLYDPNTGGGPLIGEFCHFTDLVLYLIDSIPVELIAKGGNLSHKNMDTYDSCVVIIKFKNNSIANLIYNDLNGPNMPKERIEIFSGESAIFIDDFIKMETAGFDSGNKILYEKDKGHKNEMARVIQVNLGKEEPIIDVNDALKAMDLCFKTVESIKTNKAIKIDVDNYE